MTDTTTAPKPRAARVEPIITSVIAIELPERTKRGSGPKYPFESLTVGTAFGLKNKVAKDMASVISAANRRYTTNATDENGNIQYHTKELTTAEGVKMNVPDNTKPKKVPTRHFFALDVDKEMAAKLKGTELEGSKVLISRDI